jgi:GPH family glycoside/pentoside/hexuronide:cation symporter
MDETTIAGAIPGIKMLMSWIPAIILVIAGVLGMLFYPLTDKKVEGIIEELAQRKA